MSHLPESRPVPRIASRVNPRSELRIEEPVEAVEA
jgi:hypothetical protein